MELSADQIKNLVELGALPPDVAKRLADTSGVNFGYTSEVPPIVQPAAAPLGEVTPEGAPILGGDVPDPTKAKLAGLQEIASNGMPGAGAMGVMPGLPGAPSASGIAPPPAGPPITEKGPV